jgi:hypothetical protein
MFEALRRAVWLPWCLALVGWLLTPLFLSAPTHPSEAFGYAIAGIDAGTMFALAAIPIGVGSSGHRAVGLILKAFDVLLVALATFAALTAGLGAARIDVQPLVETSLSPFGALMGLAAGMWLREVGTPASP